MVILRTAAVLLTACLLSTLPVVAQDTTEATDSTGLPGDNFSLEGALAMFKKASSPEELEKLLNSQDNGVNNLDLNNDGNIDYIRVINKSQDNSHAFILQALVSATESQDIAVIELGRTSSTNAVLQITGDEDIYGDSVIVEPQDDGSTAFNDNPSNSNTHGPNVAFAPYNPAIGIVVNVWLWPCVQFVYAPAYTPWVSPCTWHLYPTWWHAWRPMPWHAYHPVWYRYRPGYAIVRTRRIPMARTIYRPARVTSVTVINRNRVIVNNYRSNPNRPGTYRPNYGRGGNGNNRPNNAGRTNGNYNNGNRGNNNNRPANNNNRPANNGTRPSGNSNNRQQNGTRPATGTQTGNNGRPATGNQTGNGTRPSTGTRPAGNNNNSRPANTTRPQNNNNNNRGGGQQRTNSGGRENRGRN